MFYTKTFRKLYNLSVNKLNLVPSRKIRSRSKIKVEKNISRPTKSFPVATNVFDKGAKNLVDCPLTLDEADITDPWTTSPYLQNVDIKRDQTKKSLRPKVDPKNTSIILFPGQGSQFVGMGKDLIDFPSVKKMYQIASEILGYDLWDLCVNGPKSELDKTIYCQPAVVVTSLAAIQKLKEENPQAIENCFATAGFSVGEYTALVFADSISFMDAIKVVKVRAEEMQKASQLYSGGMMTVFLNRESKLKYACHTAKLWCQNANVENPECAIASYLFPECAVIGGSEEALKFIEVNATEFKFRKLKRLPVSGAFHTKLMAPAVEPLRHALQSVTINPPIISVHCNVDGTRYTDGKRIIKYLGKQLCSPVKWEQTMHVMYERTKDTRFPKTYEVGPGKQLGVMLKMTNYKAYSEYRNIPV